MAITKSIRQKLFMLLIIIGSLPLIVVVIVSARHMIDELEDVAVRNGELHNGIIAEHVTEMVEKNFYVLRTMTMNPIIVDCVLNPTEHNVDAARNVLFDTNSVFRDRNLMALTGSDARQLIRTDNSTLVNVGERQHFVEATFGREYVSDTITSMSTGRLIVVVEVPVRNKRKRPIGMIQRNLNLDELQNFVKTQGDPMISVMIIDRNGKTIAHSQDAVDFVAEQNGEGTYKFLTDRMQDREGEFRAEIDGEDTLICYSRNYHTGWLIVTTEPYHFILEQVYTRVAAAFLIGMFMLLIVSVTAYLLSIRVTRPIVQIKNAADKIVKGNGTFEKIEIDSDDELGQMAEAFNKISSERDSYQLESELDKLTRLYNKATMERVCRMKLKSFNDHEIHDSLLALYIIDLDHFKEVNDTRGHQFGDKVLSEFSRVLRKQFRPNDCIGRFGGDEFVVIIDNLPRMEIVIRKAKQIKDVASKIVIDGIDTGVTASIGIAIAPRHGTDYDTLFKSADESLYFVKAHGRNGYYYASAEQIG